MVLRGQPVGEQDVADQRRAFGREESLKRTSYADIVESGVLGARGPRVAYSNSLRGGARAANLENRILRSMRSTKTD